MGGTGRQLGRFALAGVAGLAIDVAVLYLALALGAGYYTGRLLSFLAAVWCTWQINRRFTFRDGAPGPAWTQWWRYLGAMLGGGAVNYLVYSLVVGYGPRHPLLALAGVAAGSLAGMLVNFTSARLLVFRPSAPYAYTAAMTDTPSAHFAPAGRDRLPFLDGLRAFAALWVVLGHCHLFALGWNRSGTLWGRPLDLLLYSHLGVNLFLVLSGFCLALPVVRNANRLATSQVDYFKARAWRILIPYYATLLLLLLVNAFVPLAAWGRHPVGLTADITWQVLATNLLLLQDVFWQFNSINGPFWSIATEWHLYFVFPALVWVLHRFGTRALLLCGGAAAFALTWLSFVHPRLSDALPMSVPQPPYFIALFVMGAVAASYAFDPRYAAARARLHRNGWLVGAALCVPLCVLLWRYRIVDGSNVWGFIDHLHLIDPLAGAVAAAWLLGLCGLRPVHWLRRALESRAPVAVGGFSYSLYLTHVPILAALNHALENSGLPARSPIAAFFVLATGGSALCLLFAWGFARLFERRYRARKALAAPVLLREPG